MSQQPCIFPRRLRHDFHGPVGHPERVRAVKRDLIKKYQSVNISAFENPEDAKYRHKVSYQLEPVRRLDRSVVKERRQMIVHPAKISSDTPEWWKPTYHYFRRGQVPSVKSTLDPYRMKNIDQKQYDVLNNKRTRRERFLTEGGGDRNIHSGNKSRYELISVTEKIGGGEERIPLRTNKEVSPKIGSVNHRDYSIKKTLLKIGSTKHVDTYSIF